MTLSSPLRSEPPVAEQSLAELQAENADLHARLEHYDSMISGLSEKYRRGFALFEQMRAAYSESQRSLTALQHQQDPSGMTSRKTLLSQIQSENAALRAEFQRSCSLLKAAQERITGWKAKYSSLATEMDSLRALLELSESEKDELYAKNQALLAGLDRLSAPKPPDADDFQLQELRFELSEAEEKVEELTAQLMAAGELERRNREQQSEIAALRERLRALESAE
jgi:chromosome segregation ATPase